MHLFDHRRSKCIFKEFEMDSSSEEKNIYTFVEIIRSNTFAEWKTADFPHNCHDEDGDDSDALLKQPLDEVDAKSETDQRSGLTSCLEDDINDVDLCCNC
jgi:hypothetical protein